MANANSKATENIAWYSESRFSSYWETYYKAQSWRLHQEIAFWKAKAMGADFQAQQLEYLISGYPQVNTCGTDDTEEIPGHEHKPESSRDIPTGEIEMEITDEMMAFLEQSARHRQERKDYYAKEAIRESQERLDEIQLPEDVSEANEEMLKKIYGKNAHVINAMETAVEVTFNRHCTIRQPKLWPNLPLRFPST